MGTRDRAPGLGQNSEHGRDNSLGGIDDRLFSTLGSREWHYAPIINDCGITIRGAVDAAQSTGKGGLFFTEEGGHFGTWFVENESGTKNSAFHLELQAIELGCMQAVQGRGTDEIKRVILGTDCQPARSSVTNGYSRSMEAVHRIKNIWNLKRTFNFSLELRWLPGKDNAADPISRRLPIDPERNINTFDILIQNVDLSKSSRMFELGTEI